MRQSAGGSRQSGQGGSAIWMISYHNVALSKRSRLVPLPVANAICEESYGLSRNMPIFRFFDFGSRKFRCRHLIAHNFRMPGGWGLCFGTLILRMNVYHVPHPYRSQRPLAVDTAFPKRAFFSKKVILDGLAIGATNSKSAHTGMLYCHMCWPSML